MKKTLLNITVSIAMSGALLTGSVLNTQAYAANSASITPDSSNGSEATLKTYMYPGMGVGAATGTVVAGPVGFLIGGIIGAVIGSRQELTESSSLASASDTITYSSVQQDKHAVGETVSAKEPGSSIDSSLSTTDDRSTATPGIQVAQAGLFNAVISQTDDTQKEELIDRLTTDLSLDVYFRSGSADIESFYPARLAAIAGLLNTMNKLGQDKLELHLEGYTDRRGEASQNIALANERIEKVRQQLIAAGVTEDRINYKAFGEMKMVSTAGDLEGYTFDRKVVIRFERTAADSIGSMNTALSGFDSEKTGLSDKDENLSPVVADNSSRF